MHDREEVKYTMSQHQAGRGQPDPDPEEPELDICMDDALDTLPSVPPAPSRTSSNRSSFPVAHAAHVSPPTPWFTIFSNGSCTGCNLGQVYYYGHADFLRGHHRHRHRSDRRMPRTTFYPNTRACASAATSESHHHANQLAQPDVCRSVLQLHHISGGWNPNRRFDGGCLVKNRDWNICDAGKKQAHNPLVRMATCF